MMGTHFGQIWAGSAKFGFCSATKECVCDRNWAKLEKIWDRFGQIRGAFDHVWTLSIKSWTVLGTTGLSLTNCVACLGLFRPNARRP